MIEVTNLTKRYGTITALSGVTFSIEPGEIVGFLGPNGAGKTTTIRILTGVTPPSNGEAFIDGLSCTADSLSVRERIGYLPENVPLYGDMSVTRFLKFAAEAKGILKPRRTEEINRVLEDCALEGMENRLIKFLSKGYRQRVGLAQALLNQPKVLILDEPTIGLDPAQIVEIRGLIGRLSQKATILLSTHILPEVSQLCNRVIILNQGHVVAIDTPEGLRAQTRPSGQVFVHLKGNPPEAGAMMGSVPGVLKVSEEKDQTGWMVDVVSDEEVRPELVRRLLEAGFELLEIRSLGLSLEEIFIKLVTEEKPDEKEGQA